mgnify:FL=1
MPDRFGRFYQIVSHEINLYYPTKWHFLLDYLLQGGECTQSKNSTTRIEIDKRVFYKWGVNDGKTWFFQHLANRFPKKHHELLFIPSFSLRICTSDIKGKENWQFSPPLDIFKEDILQVPELFFLYLKFRSLIRLLWGKTPTCRETGS